MNFLRISKNKDIYMAIEDNYIYIVDRAKNVLAKHKVLYDIYCGYQCQVESKVVGVLNAYKYKVVICNKQIYVQCLEKVYKLKGKELVLVFTIPELKASTLSFFGMIAPLSNQLYVLNNIGQMYIYNESENILENYVYPLNLENKISRNNNYYRGSNFYHYCDQVYLFRHFFIANNQKMSKIIHYKNCLLNQEIVLQCDIAQNKYIQFVTFTQGGIMCVKLVQDDQPQTVVVDMVPKDYNILDEPADQNIIVHAPVPTTNGQFKPIVGDTGLELDEDTVFSQISDVTKQQIEHNKIYFEKYAIQNIYNNSEIQQLINFDVIIQYVKINSGYVTNFNTLAKKFNDLSYKIRQQINDTSQIMIGLFVKTDQFLSTFKLIIE
ncbi:Conserved_hypothetical protein [Hexamita inflata]|uniref:Uncharacterized protein n=1 Tax=Hexamita inflata TaxID=28002 RepID=A0ABP1GY45_9EUKA